MPLILPGNVGSATAVTGFNVANSVRMDAASSSKMAIDFSGAGNQKKFTISCWVKRAKITPGASQTILSNYADVNNFCNFTLNTSDKLSFVNRDGGTFNTNIATTRLFRDPSSFYHVVLSVDTTQSTDTNRIKMYVNGVQETSFSTSTYPDQNTDLKFNTTATTNFGSWSGSAQYADGYYSELCFINDAQLAADQFGEFDSDSGIWKPIDVSGLTFGTNGFYLDFEDSANLGNDANGGTDLTETNLAATDQSTDTCTNNFATLNPLDLYHNATANTQSTSSEGNLYYTVASGNKGFARSTFGVSAGKWYFEVEANSVGKGFYGVCNAGIMEDGTALQPSAVYYYEAVPDFRSGDQIITTNAVSVSAGSILGFALDMDNHALYISKDGTYMNSGDPTSGSSRTGAISELFTTGRAILSDFGEVFANVANTSTTGGLDAKVNFGSPFYSESGGNSDGNGHGNFKTAPPSGYLAFCTKNLAKTGG